MWQFLRNKWHSLIFRLLFYFLLSFVALALVLAVSFAQRIKPHVRNEVLPNIERYIEYLIADIGQPPNLQTAARLADELPFELRIEGPGVEWTSSPRLRSTATYRFEAAPAPYDNVYFSHHRRDEFMLIEQDGYRYLFSVDNSYRHGSERRHWVLLLALGSILLLLYLAIRRMFRPVAAMSAQVEKIGAGDLEQNIVQTGQGELAQLARGIDRMALRIKSMLEGKSGLLLAISHELRSPMTRMRVNLELLEQSELRDQLIDDIREMENLVSAILESEKIASGHAPLNLENCDLSSLIEEVIRAHACRERIRASLGPATHAVDRLRIKLLLKNLIDNACNYSSADSIIEVRLSAGGECVLIEVEDHGEGIAAQEIERLGEAFYRPDSARQRETGGYGLGLYLCRLIAAAHGGELVIKSEPGKGTRVLISLPIDNS